MRRAWVWRSTARARACPARRSALRAPWVASRVSSRDSSVTSSRSGRDRRQAHLFTTDVTRSRGRRRTSGDHSQEEDGMEKDRARRPLFELEPQTTTQAAKIKVIGLGGGGGNAVSRMMAAQFTGVEFI